MDVVVDVNREDRIWEGVYGMLTAEGGNIRIAGCVER